MWECIYLDAMYNMHLQYEKTNREMEYTHPAAAANYYQNGTIITYLFLRIA